MGIKECLREHTVVTAWERGWSTLLNGQLLQAAEAEGFDVLLTTDKNVQYQQNLSGRKIAVVVLGQARWALIRLKLDLIREAIENVQPGTVTVVEVA